jgi:N-glycosylase/DNA lyase
MSGGRAPGWSTEIPLTGAGGEPVDLARTLRSHGLVELPPMRLEDGRPELEATLSLPGRRPRTVRIAEAGARRARVLALGRPPGPREGEAIVAAVRHILRLDQDLSRFYERVREDPELAWAAAGAGRMMRSQTVFEDVVKTVCTTNCAWSGTERMVGALVAKLGKPAPTASPAGVAGRAFPTPAAMAAVDDGFYREVVRAGYRGPFLRTIAVEEAAGRLDLEALGRASPDQLPDDELALLLESLPGVGPYAAAHIMMMLGRFSRLVLDSWTRPTYLRVSGRRRAADRTIERRFRRYGPWAGLAFWLLLTRGWVEEQDAAGRRDLG